MLEYICKTCGALETANDFKTIVRYEKQCKGCYPLNKFERDKLKHLIKKDYDYMVARHMVISKNKEKK